MSTRHLIAVLTAIMLVVACQQEVEMTPVTDKSALIGKWKEAGQTVEVFEDGTIIHTDKFNTKTNGKYEFIDGNIIRIEYEGFEKQEYKASVYQKKLLLTGVEDSSTSRLTRVE
jgi:lipocalin